MTLVFFIVFFNVYQGVQEVSPVVLANARMLGASRAAAAAPRLPAERDELGVLEPAHLGRAWRSSARWSASTWARRSGVGYLILQAEGAFDINTVFAGILVLTAFALVLDWHGHARPSGG